MERSAQPGIPACARWYGSTEAFEERLGPAGEVPTGSFETKEPGEAELKRREKWAREEA